jgi:UDP:flavonoid glycosyltransferase YjiC (YdhE family)
LARLLANIALVRVLLVTWAGGGNVQPAIGLGRMLVARGHDVRILAPESLGARVRAAGCRHEPWPAALEVDPIHGRAFEDQWDRIYHGTLLGEGLAAAVRAVLEVEPADVAAVDMMLRSALFAVEGTGTPLVCLMHLTYRNNAERGDEDPDAEWGWRWQYAQLNNVRAKLGLRPLPVGPANPSIAIAARAAAALVVMPAEFDDWPDPPPTVTHVGPIFEEALPNEPGPHDSVGSILGSPWSADDRRPLIVVSLGTTYMHQEEVLGRIGAAVAGLDARVLMLTGRDLDPVEVRGLDRAIVVRRFVPHAAVLPEAALLITHAGMGSVMAAFAAGIPMICIPLGRDQDANAERAAELGTSITLSTNSARDEIASAVSRVLGSAEMRAASGRMQTAVGRYDGGRLAVERVEHIGEPVAREH